MPNADFESVEDYIESQREDLRGIAGLVRDTIRNAVPEAKETISYQMPTYILNGQRLLYFAVWKRHFSLYGATEKVVAAFKEELAAYEVKKGTIQFPLAKPVPVDLIKRIAKWRAKEVAAGGNAIAIS
jgi:uncharacterized protein YdhG (YjbR/CyaY superfamily)